MIALYIVTAALLLAGAVFNRKKTAAGVKKSAMMFLNLLPAFLSIIMLVSIVLTALGPETIERWLGSSSGPLGFLAAALLGAVALIPGFVAYPMAGMLLKSGVTYPVLAVFITTLMMVGILTLPIEKKFFGWKVALVRNALSFAGALLIGGAMALVWSLI